MPPETVSSKSAYDPVAKTFHWLTALAVLAMLAIGWTMADGGLNPLLFHWHKSIGITILALILLRLAWRLISPPPPLPTPMPNWQRTTAITTHRALYLLLIVMPLTGWMIVTCFGGTTLLYGMIPLPDLPLLSELSNKADIGEQLEEVHESLAMILAGLLTLHIGAALKHHFIDRDDVLLRMSPGFLSQSLRKIRGET
ncbi:MAG: cytochrome b [Alphaproteobacteria bacterium]|nr:cytochrome b [Alphaproteobacteria bacterium]